MIVTDERTKLKVLVESMSDASVAAILPAVRKQVDQLEFVAATLEHAGQVEDRADRRFGWELEDVPTNP
jgi:hypothetical protein